MRVTFSLAKFKQFFAAWWTVLFLISGLGGSNMPGALDTSSLNYEIDQSKN